MPRVKEAKLSNCDIYVYAPPKEHPPPHFHLLGPDTDCSVDLASFEVMKGHYSQKDLKEAIEWLEDGNNLKCVWDLWRVLNERD